MLDPLLRPTYDARVARLVRWALVIAFGGVLLVGLRLSPFYRRMVPRWLERDVVLAILQGGRIVYVAALVFAAIAFVGGLVWALRARSRRRAWEPAARWAVLGASILLTGGALELGAAGWLASSRFPDLPTDFPAMPSGSSNADEQTRTIVVVGESSGRGEPYQPWLSVAQIVAWQLERVFPGTRFNVDMRAQGGLSLEQAIAKLIDLQRRPDAVLICSGHNEFQARFSWSRTVAYYADEDPQAAPSRLLRHLLRASPLCRLIEQGLERNRLEQPPPAHATRGLVDRPAFTAEEYAFLLEDYRLRLDDLLDWCNRDGTLPIVVVPAGNDTAFPPNRSYLDPATAPEERRRFAQDFEAAVALEKGGSAADALSAYRALIDRQPLFAEAHYRYAQALQGSGAPTDEHFTRARDLDGMPLRMPSDFQAAARAAAREHDAILIDTQHVLDADRRADLFHDPEHPTFAGYVALAQDLLEQLHARGAFGWPASTPVPTIDPAECAAHFGLDARRWATVCERSSDFYGRIAYIRYDPSPHLARALEYEEAGRRIAAGESLDGLQLATLGIDPAWLTPRVAAPSASAPPPATPAPPQAEAEAESTPGGQSVPDPAVIAACKTAAAGLAAGDTAGFAALAPDQRAQLVHDPAVTKLFVCLAVGADTATHCETLPPSQKEDCAAQWQLAHDIRSLPPQSVKFEILYRTCLPNGEKADCDRALEAMTTHDPAKCESLSRVSDRSFCAAFASGDPASCDQLTLRAERSFCAAIATDDPSRCPEDAIDCINMARAFATWKMNEAGKNADPTTGAIRWGVSACAPLAAEFERSCAAAAGNAGEAPAH
jgi:hypothetical protein